MTTRMETDLLRTGEIHDLADRSKITFGMTPTVQTSSTLPLLVMRGQRRVVSHPAPMELSQNMLKTVNARTQPGSVVVSVTAFVDGAESLVLKGTDPALGHPRA